MGLVFWICFAAYLIGMFPMMVYAHYEYMNDKDATLAAFIWPIFLIIIIPVYGLEFLNGGARTIARKLPR